jgi:hypothetical protein
MRQAEIRHDERAARCRRRPKPYRSTGASEATSAAAAESMTRQAVRKGVTSMLVAAALLLVFNSGGLRIWARSLPGNAATDMLVEGVDRWHGMMQHAGFATAMTAVQDAVAAFRGQGWPDTDMLSRAGTVSPASARPPAPMPPPDVAPRAAGL